MPATISVVRDSTTRKSLVRAAIEIAFIIFLFYANLMMGEFEHSAAGAKRGFLWAIADVFTATNFVMAAGAAIVGYVVFEYLRKRF